MFLSELESGGDYEFGRRLTQSGELIRYAKKALVFHPARSTFKSKLKKSKLVEIEQDVAKAEENRRHEAQVNRLKSQLKMHLKNQS